MRPKKFNIQIPINSVPVTVTKGQKEILEEMVIDLYSGVERILMNYDTNQVVQLIKENVAEHYQNLIKLIEEENKYIIEIEYQESIMVFDVEPMIEYGYTKNEIIEEIYKLGLEEFLSLENTFVLKIFDKPWVIEKRGNQIKVMSGLSPEVLKIFE